MCTNNFKDRINIFLSMGVATIASLSLGIGNISIAHAQTASSNTPRLSPNPRDLRDAFDQDIRNVNTPEEFADYLRTHQALRQRYSRHFNVPQDKVVDFFRNSVVPTTLKKSQRLITFGVTKSGTIYAVKTRLPKGTPVWATREGVPVVKWNCGNPLARKLPGSDLVSQPVVVSNAPSNIQLAEADVPFLEVSETEGLVDIPPSNIVALQPPLEETVVGSSMLPISDLVTGAVSHSKDGWPFLLLPIGLLIPRGNNSDEVPIPPIYQGETPPLNPIPPIQYGETPPYESIVTPPSTVPEGNTGMLCVIGLPLIAGGFILARRRRIV